MKRFHSVWDAEHWTDGMDYDSFEEAKADCLETLATWMIGFWLEHKALDQKTAEEWDSMIYGCSVWVGEGDSPDDIKEVWSPSEKELFELGWVEFDKLGFDKMGEHV